MSTKRSVYHIQPYLVTYSQSGRRRVLFRISDGLAIGWDAGEREEFVFGRYRREGDELVLRIKLAPQSWTESGRQE